MGAGCSENQIHELSKLIFLQLAKFFLKKEIVVI